MTSLLIRKVLLSAALSFAVIACFAQNIEEGKSLTAPDDTTARSSEYASPQISPNNNTETRSYHHARAVVEKETSKLGFIGLAENFALPIQGYIDKKRSSLIANELLFKTAAIYSPTFTQYHRRGWA